MVWFNTENILQWLKARDTTFNRNHHLSLNFTKLILLPKLKVVIAIFISLSFTAPMAIIGNCRCVFGPHFSFSFLDSGHWPFICLFSHTNCLLTTLAKTVRHFTHRWVEDRVRCVKSLTVHRLWFFRESRSGHNIANARAFISGP